MTSGLRLHCRRCHWSDASRQTSSEKQPLQASRGSKPLRFAFREEPSGHSVEDGVCLRGLGSARRSVDSALDWPGQKERTGAARG